MIHGNAKSACYYISKTLLFCALGCIFFLQAEEVVASKRHLAFQPPRRRLSAQVHCETALEDYLKLYGELEVCTSCSKSPSRDGEDDTWQFACNAKCKECTSSGDCFQSSYFNWYDEMGHYAFQDCHDVTPSGLSTCFTSFFDGSCRSEANGQICSECRKCSDSGTAEDLFEGDCGNVLPNSTWSECTNEYNGPFASYNDETESKCTSTGAASTSSGGGPSFVIREAILVVSSVIATVLQFV